METHLTHYTNEKLEAFKEELKAALNEKIDETVNNMFMDLYNTVNNSYGGYYSVKRKQNPHNNKKTKKMYKNH